MTVLVVEDDPDQLALRSMLLERSGFAVVAALDCEEALRLAAARKPVCAVIDLRLPTEERGLQLIRRLKELNAKLCVIVLTGGDVKRLRSLPEACIIDEFLAKPVSSQHLVEVLKLTGAR